MRLIQNVEYFSPDDDDDDWEEEEDYRRKSEEEKEEDKENMVGYNDRKVVLLNPVLL
ncbi:hypothetical protein DPMN_086182 [Dreissena polymorpha]|uniref:Uncharacterized protein n=1 Tax=Dreissena polymorpha TaxID=45954 RepID=A0A9D3YDN2_DREPO|nr:hypothetical protein DPMN_086182 [Dreissena polymorpha]